MSPDQSIRELLFALPIPLKGDRSADFGIALAVSAPAGGRMTETGLSLGTPHYMSPEQATAEKILAQAGDADALDEIERLLASPSELSVHTLGLDPRWDPIREHQRFQALLVKYASPATN